MSYLKLPHVMDPAVDKMMTLKLRVSHHVYNLCQHLCTTTDHHDICQYLHEHFKQILEYHAPLQQVNVMYDIPKIQLEEAQIILPVVTNTAAAVEVQEQISLSAVQTNCSIVSEVNSYQEYSMASTSTVYRKPCQPIVPKVEVIDIEQTTTVISAFVSYHTEKQEEIIFSPPCETSVSSSVTFHATQTLALFVSDPILKSAECDIRYSTLHNPESTGVVSYNLCANEFLYTLSAYMSKAIRSVPAYYNFIQSLSLYATSIYILWCCRLLTWVFHNSLPLRLQIMVFDPGISSESI